jgi:hypothetical protein
MGTGTSPQCIFQVFFIVLARSQSPFLNERAFDSEFAPDFSTYRGREGIWRLYELLKREIWGR